jgi:hypothetical protein
MAPLLKMSAQSETSLWISVSVFGKKQETEGGRVKWLGSERA